MVSTKRPGPSPDNGKVEHLLRTQIGREITEMFKIWDDSFKSPEFMLEHGLITINIIGRRIEEAAVQRRLMVEMPDGRRLPVTSAEGAAEQRRQDALPH